MYLGKVAWSQNKRALKCLISPRILIRSLDFQSSFLSPSYFFPTFQAWKSFLLSLWKTKEWKSGSTEKVASGKGWLASASVDYLFLTLRFLLHLLLSDFSRCWQTAFFRFSSLFFFFFLPFMKSSPRLFFHKKRKCFPSFPFSALIGLRRARSRYLYSHGGKKRYKCYH